VSALTAYRGPKSALPECLQTDGLHWEGLGVVLKIDASPQMIIVASNSHSKDLGEEEYSVDPRLVCETSAIPSDPLFRALSHQKGAQFLGG
jgi:hypothetical protein